MPVGYDPNNQNNGGGQYDRKPAFPARSQAYEVTLEDLFWHPDKPWVMLKLTDGTYEAVEFISLEEPNGCVKESVGWLFTAWLQALQYPNPEFWANPEPRTFTEDELNNCIGRRCFITVQPDNSPRNPSGIKIARRDPAMGGQPTVSGPVADEVPY